MWKLTHLRAKGVENNYGTMGTDILSAVGNNANQPASFTVVLFFPVVENQMQPAPMRS